MLACVTLLITEKVGIGEFSLRISLLQLKFDKKIGSLCINNIVSNWIISWYLPVLLTITFFKFTSLFPVAVYALETR